MRKEKERKERKKREEKTRRRCMGKERKET